MKKLVLVLVAFLAVMPVFAQKAEDYFCPLKKVVYTYQLTYMDSGKFSNETVKVAYYEWDDEFQAGALVLDTDLAFGLGSISDAYDIYLDKVVRGGGINVLGMIQSDSTQVFAMPGEEWTVQSTAPGEYYEYSSHAEDMDIGGDIYDCVLIIKKVYVNNTLRFTETKSYAKGYGLIIAMTTDKNFNPTNSYIFTGIKKR
jgi:hypothetical protein